MAPRTSEVTDRAAYWVVQLRAPDSPPDLQQQFGDWLRASPIHVREYLHAVELWEALAHPEAAPCTPSDLLTLEALEAKPIAWVKRVDDAHVSHSGVLESTPPPLIHSRSRGARAIGIALALLLAGLLGFAGWIRLSAAYVETGIGELRSAVLPDHSIVELNTRSEIRLAYSSTERRVELLQGEAFFTVAKDPNRPFVVSTDVATVRAVGTRFSVYRRKTATLVTVAEGRVLVRDSTTTRQSGSVSDPGSVEVNPGNQAEARAGKPVITHHANLQRSLAWRERRLIFEGEPLANVVAEFNRYNATSLVIADPRLEEQRISGVFDANDPDSLLDFLVKVDHIPVVRQERGPVLIGNDGHLPDRYSTQPLDRS